MAVDRTRRVLLHPAEPLDQQPDEVRADSLGDELWVFLHKRLGWPFASDFVLCLLSIF